MYPIARTLAAVAALALLPLVAGCATGTVAQGDGTTLMERYHSGQDLMADNAGGEPKAEAQKHLLRGRVYAAQGRQELAFEQFSRAAHLDPELAEARLRRGEILMDKGLFDQALVEFTDVAERLPDYAPAQEAAGLVYFREGLYPEAEEHLTRAVALDPGSVRALTHLGAIHNYRRDFDKAVAAFQAAIQAAPTDGTTYNNLGLTYSMMGDDAGAVEAFRTALRLGAPTAKAYNNMGLALARLGREAEALEAFRCAEGEAAAYNNLGYVHFLDGNYARAIASFERAIELEPTYYDRAHENLKRARMALRFEEGESGGPVHAALSGPLPALGAGGVVAALPVGPLTLASGSGAGPALTVSDPQPGVPAPAPARSRSLAPRIPAVAPQAPAAPVRPVSTVRPASALVAQAAATPPGREDVPRRFMAPELGDKPQYVLHYSSWRKRYNALRDAGKLKEQGYDTTVIPVTVPGSGDWWRVAIGSYANLQDARAALAELKHREGFESLRIVRRSLMTPQGPRDL